MLLKVEHYVSNVPVASTGVQAATYKLWELMGEFFYCRGFKLPLRKSGSIADGFRKR